jgi:metal-responsive CopG/Arc/MetJ family transcriptional regulator
MSSQSSSRKNYRTGVSLEPEVVRSLDELVVQTGLNRSWVLNTIVREYLRLAAAGNTPPLMTREAIISA